mmetsp:Transcript_24098/g.67681  ORF Transcript_24098/g.67681 Transcript_24098/m.67681 type:complete len:254 (+) Transcript_24098:1634-2395(+)
MCAGVVHARAVPDRPVLQPDRAPALQPPGTVGVGVLDRVLGLPDGPLRRGDQLRAQERHRDLGALQPVLESDVLLAFVQHLLRRAVHEEDVGVARVAAAGHEVLEAGHGHAQRGRQQLGHVQAGVRAHGVLLQVDQSQQVVAERPGRAVVGELVQHPPEEERRLGDHELKEHALVLLDLPPLRDRREAALQQHGHLRGPEERGPEVEGRGGGHPAVPGRHGPGVRPLLLHGDGLLVLGIQRCIRAHGGLRCSA